MRSYNKPLFMIGVPTVGGHSWLFTNSLLGGVTPSNFSMQIRFVPHKEVGRARNILMQEAVNIGAKYLMFRDEDTLAPGNLIPMLIYHLENHEDWTFVGGLYSTKNYPSEPLIYMDWGTGPYWNFKKGEMVGPIKYTGMGASIIRVSDIVNLPAPAYMDKNPWDGTAMEVHEWFKTGDVQIARSTGTEKSSNTEDAHFFKYLEEAGLKAYVDTGLLCGHYDAKTGITFFPPFENQVALLPDAWNHSPRIVNLGAGGEYDPYELQVDLRKEPHIDFVADIRALPYEWENQFDIAKASHVLEHFGFQQSAEVLAEWYRIIKPGGLIQIKVPDLEGIAQGIVEGRFDAYVQGGIYGDQGHPFWDQPAYGGYDEEDAEGNKRPIPRFLPHSKAHNYHKSGYTARYLIDLLKDIGFVDVVANRDLNMWELRVQGQKPKPAEPQPEATLPAGFTEIPIVIEDRTRPVEETGATNGNSS